VRSKRAGILIVDDDASTVTIERSIGGVSVKIADYGPGIPSEALDSIFDPFVRLETSRSRATGGSGLASRSPGSSPGHTAGNCICATGSLTVWKPGSSCPSMFSRVVRTGICRQAFRSRNRPYFVARTDCLSDQPHDRLDLGVVALPRATREAPTGLCHQRRRARSRGIGTVADGRYASLCQSHRSRSVSATSLSSGRCRHDQFGT
jgi:Histidine kinase-, DNA gyrase B-, and HSP90-like ATPase